MAKVIANKGADVLHVAFIPKLCGDHAHAGGVANLRRTERTIATANHITSNHNAAFAAAANATPVSDEGAERNGPPGQTTKQLLRVAQSQKLDRGPPME